MGLPVGDNARQPRPGQRRSTGEPGETRANDGAIGVVLQIHRAHPADPQLAMSGLQDTRNALGPAARRVDQGVQADSMLPVGVPFGINQVWFYIAVGSSPRLRRYQ